MVDPFGWHTLTRDDASHVLQKLTDFESMTWREILFGSKKQHHSVTIDQICKEARERLEAIGLGDVESIISLRLSGQERIWGLRLDSTLLILWWDPTHQVCPSPKKYT